MPDIYTKIVLTVIAVSLSAIALQGSPITRARADPEACGDYNHRCYVELITSSSPDDMPIKISNSPDRLER